MVFGAAAGVKVLDDHVVLGPEIFGSTVLTGAQAVSLHNTPFEMIFGGHLTFARDWRAGVGVGPGLSRGFGSPEVRTVASLEWAPAWKAPPPSDRDHDGVPDAEDACPDVPGIRTDDPRTNGCPPVIKPADRDGDGIPDTEDACPDVPGIRTNDPKTNGCPPVVKVADRDGDGIPDAEDACPDVPGVRTDDPKTNGCPSDRDKDGIPDAQDACPDNPGPPNPDPAKNGCPIALVQKGQIRIMEQIKFRTGSAELDPASDSVLEAVRAVFVAHAEIRRLRVEGHTDNVGSVDYNLHLSKTRARSVMDWLVKHGIESKRLESQGYGFMRPIAENTTDAGRRDNRRVEFHIVEGGPALEEEK
jgi:outer membrane protein OmpA-like peptidoglycan-associated protein